jgi:formylglycine-generating enzyme required for sulfatase activity
LQGAGAGTILGAGVGVASGGGEGERLLAGEAVMLRWAVIFLVVALVAGLFGLTRADDRPAPPKPLDCTGPTGADAAVAREARQNWATYLGKPVTDTIDLGRGVKLEVVLIPAGMFTMGSPADEKGRRGNETQHQVTISRPIYLGTRSVTVGQFRRFADDTGYRTEAESTGRGSLAFDGVQAFNMNKDRNWRSPGFAQTDEHPVTCVTWNDAVKFCEWLSRRDGQTCRLPTEAEWEYSCRGGRPPSQPFGIGDGRSLSSNQANFNGNYPYGGAGKGPYLKRTCPVGSYTANDWGLYDMHGNVWEWCGDGYVEYPPGGITDPMVSATSALRVYRGGGWTDRAQDCRAAFRFRCSQVDRYTVLGFRIARVPSGRDK